jgi:predicted O-methyltransferase YrrM
MKSEEARELLKVSSLMALDITPFMPIQTRLRSQGQPRFRAMMNALVRCMEGDEVYLEIGSYQGGSMIGALLNNDKRAYAVEDFREFYGDPIVDNTRATLENNLRAFGVFERVTLYETDFHAFFDCVTIPPVGLYYYDAQHATKDTLEGFELGFPHVVKGGFIIADDIAWDMVSLALNQFIGAHPAELKIVFAATPNGKEGWLDDDWWNGVIVFQKLGE